MGKVGGRRVVNSAIFQLYHGEKKLIFNEMKGYGSVTIYYASEGFRYVVEHISEIVYS